MNTLLLAALIAASGDPYVKQTTPPHLLTEGERTTLANSVLARAPGLEVGSLLEMRCVVGDTSGCCTPYSADAQTAAAVRALLLSGVTWVPSPVSDSQYKSWPDICVAGNTLNSFKTLVRNIDGTVTGLPIYNVTYTRTPGTLNVYQSVDYGVEGTEAWIATRLDEILEPTGVVP